MYVDEIGIKQIGEVGTAQDKYQQIKVPTNKAKVTSRAKRDLDIQIKVQRKQNSENAKSNRKKDEYVALGKRLCELATLDC